MIFKEKKVHSNPKPLFNPKKRKPFPKHWGEPPKRQTRDLRPLPGDMGWEVEPLLVGFRKIWIVTKRIKRLAPNNLCKVEINI